MFARQMRPEFMIIVTTCFAQMIGPRLKMGLNTISCVSTITNHATHMARKWALYIRSLGRISLRFCATWRTFDGAKTLVKSGQVIFINST